MQKQAVAPSDLGSHLTDGLEEGLGLDITGRAADLGDDHVRAGLLTDPVDKGLDLAGDVRDDLHGLAQIFACTLLTQHIPVHLTGGQVGKLVEVFVDKAFVMSEIQVGFRAVLGDEYFTVLERAHGTRIDVDIGVELLGCDLEPAAFEQTAERSGGDALAQTGDHAAGYENIFGHVKRPFLC